MPESYDVGPFRLDPEALALFRNAEPLALSRRAVTLLHLLIQRPGELVTKDRLVQAAWDGLVVEESNLTVQIASLRRVLSTEPGGERWIETLPRRGYRYVGPVAASATKAFEVNVGTSGPPPVPDKPSIVVLPFQNIGGDSTQDYFLDGLLDDLTVALGREKWLFVIAGQSARAIKAVEADPREIAVRLGVRYVLRGSVRLSDEQVCIVAQLTDALNRQQVWSERFEDRVDNIFDMQDRLAAKVAAMIAPALMSVEVQRALRKPTESLTAFDLYLHALPKFNVSQAENSEALHLLKQAIELDPAYATAYALAARCYHFQLMFAWNFRGNPELDEGGRLCRRAVQIGGNDSEALWMAGLALVHLEGEVQHAAALIERSLSLNPNSANAWIASSNIRFYLGDYDASIDHFGRARRLNPLDHTQHLQWNIIGLTYIGSGRYSDALDAAERGLSIRPTYLPGLRVKIAACGLLGRIEEGQAALQKLLAVQPGYSCTWHRRFLDVPLQRNPQALERILEGARLAGVPET